jgi:hypothetical protein
VKKLLVIALEKTCTIKDKVLNVLPTPNWVMDSDWKALNWIYGCNLATLSAELDEKWATGLWKETQK